MKIFVFGGGYVGKAVARYWKEQGFFVTITTRKAEKVPLLTHSCDKVYLINRPEDIVEELSKGSYDALLFSVAAGGAHLYEEAYYENAALINTAINESPSIRQILYTGSLSVYGDQKGALVNEKSPLFPATNQATILAATEELLMQSAQDSRRVCILRLGQIVGPGRTFSEFLRKRAGIGLLPGDGESLVNISPLDDIVMGLDFALLKGLDGIYNFCNDYHYKRKELYAFICKRIGLPLPEWDPNAKSIHGSNKRISNAKIKKAGFRFLPFTPV